MNLEKTNFDKKENIETNLEQEELTANQKRDLGESWTKMVVDNIEIPENIAEMEQDKIKNWLFESIINDTKKFIGELGIKIDKSLSKKIKSTDDLNERSAFELEYIRKAHENVDAIVQNFDNSGNKSTYWDSWPKRMRETKEFNCVGATLIGMCLLEEGGIESYYGNPVGHVLNIAKLSNGEYWYVDFRNGKNNMIKIEPEEITIAGAPVLKINQKDIDYKLIPKYKNEEIPFSVLGNFQVLKKYATDPSIPDETIEKREAKEYLEKYNQVFNRIDFSVYEKLYPELINVDESSEMKKEAMRLKGIRDFQEPAMDYLKTLTKEQKNDLVKEIKAKKEAIRDLFYNDSPAVWRDADPKLKKILELFLFGLDDLKERNPGIYQEAVDKIIGKAEKI